MGKCGLTGLSHLSVASVVNFSGSAPLQKILDDYGPTLISELKNGYVQMRAVLFILYHD